MGEGVDLQGGGVGGGRGGGDCAGRAPGEASSWCRRVLQPESRFAPTEPRAVGEGRSGGEGEGGREEEEKAGGGRRAGGAGGGLFAVVVVVATMFMLASLEEDVRSLVAGSPALRALASLLMRGALANTKRLH
ncbi:unnamed protein product [Lampetra planeri]